MNPQLEAIAQQVMANPGVYGLVESFIEDEWGLLTEITRDSLEGILTPQQRYDAEQDAFEHYVETNALDVALGILEKL